MASNENSNENNDVFLNVYLYDPVAKSSEVTNVLSVGPDSLNSTLQKVRQTLHSALGSNTLTLAFCTRSGAQVADSLPYDKYRKLIAQKDEGTEHDVFLHGKPSKEKAKSTLSESVQEVLNKGLDLDLSKAKPELLKATVQEISSAYTHADYKAEAGAEKAKTPANMTQEDWLTVLQHTNFLSGHRLVFGKGPTGLSMFHRMERAPYQGFRLQTRYYEPLDASRNRNIDASSWLEIPLFIVDDESYVDVFETQSDVSQSMARSSFSKTDIQASAGGSAFGYSASVSAGFSRNESNALSTTTKSTGKLINITYNFPRVVLHLEPDALVMSEELKREIETVRRLKTEDALLTLHRKFGHFFATRVELGGRLYSSEDFSTFGSASTAEAASAMKASASASFSGPSVQASASYSKEEQQNSSSSNSISRLQRSISWQAQGGDTLLCNNPAKWCGTVAPFENWRVIKQDDVVSLGELISKFDGYDDVPQLFEEIAGLTKKREKVYFRLRVDSDRGKGKYLSVTETGGNIASGIIGEITRSHTPTPVPGAIINPIAATSAISASIVAANATKGEAYRIVKHRTQEFKAGAILSGLDVDSTFEVEVDTFLGQPAEMRYGRRMRIKNRKTQRYLSATYPEIPEMRDRLFLFPGEEHDATDFVFATPGVPSNHSAIRNGELVEVRVFDKGGALRGFIANNPENAVCSKPWTDADKNDVLFFRIELVTDLQVV